MLEYPPFRQYKLETYLEAWSITRHVVLHIKRIFHIWNNSPNLIPDFTYHSWRTKTLRYLEISSHDYNRSSHDKHALFLSSWTIWQHSQTKHKQAQRAKKTSQCPCHMFSVRRSQSAICGIVANYVYFLVLFWFQLSSIFFYFLAVVLRNSTWYFVPVPCFLIRTTLGTTEKSWQLQNKWRRVWHQCLGVNVFFIWTMSQQDNAT